MSAVSFSKTVDVWTLESTYLNYSRFKPIIVAPDQESFDIQEVFLKLDTKYIRSLNNSYLYYCKSSMAVLAKLVILVAKGTLAAPCGVVWNGSLMGYHVAKSIAGNFWGCDTVANKREFEKFWKASSCFKEDAIVAIIAYSPLITARLMFDSLVRASIVAAPYEKLMLELEIYAVLILGILPIFQLVNFVSELFSSVSEQVKNRSLFYQAINRNSLIGDRPDAELDMWISKYIATWFFEEFGIVGSDGKVLKLEGSFDKQRLCRFFDRVYFDEYRSRLSGLLDDLASSARLSVSDIKMRAYATVSEAVEAYRLRVPSDRFIRIKNEAKSLDQTFKKIVQLFDDWAILLGLGSQKHKIKAFDSSSGTSGASTQPTNVGPLKHLDLTRLRKVEISSSDLTMQKLKKYIAVREIVCSKIFRSKDELKNALENVLGETTSKSVMICFHPDAIKRAHVGGAAPEELIEEANQLLTTVNDFLK